MSSEDGKTAASVLLMEVLDAWTKRNERRGAALAGQLMFWSDGMLHELRQIADGRGDEKTYESLSRKFRDTVEPMQEALEKLTHVRNQMAGSKTARLINEIVARDEFYDGKPKLRDDIEGLISTVDRWNIQHLASDLCSRIAEFNRRVERLYQAAHE